MEDSVPHIKDRWLCCCLPLPGYRSSKYILQFWSQRFDERTSEQQQALIDCQVKHCCPCKPCHLIGRRWRVVCSWWRLWACHSANFAKSYFSCEEEHKRLRLPIWGGTSFAGEFFSFCCEFACIGFMVKLRSVPVLLANWGKLFRALFCMMVWVGLQLSFFCTGFNQFSVVSS